MVLSEIGIIREIQHSFEGEGMETTVGLIRHGVIEWNNLGKAQGISDIPLKDEGITQAKALANSRLVSILRQQGIRKHNSE